MAKKGKSEKEMLLRSLRSVELAERSNALRQLTPSRSDVASIWRAMLPNHIELKRAGLEALEKLPVEASVRVYEAILALSDDPDLKTAVIERLDGSASKRQADLLLLAARDSEIDIQAEALSAIAEAPFPSARELLRRKVDNPQGEVADRLNEDDPKVVELWASATLGLAKLQDETTIEVLVDHVTAPGTPRHEPAKTALKQLGTRNVIRRVLEAAAGCAENREALEGALSVIEGSPYLSDYRDELWEMLRRSIENHRLNLPNVAVALLADFADGELLDRVAGLLAADFPDPTSQENGRYVLRSQPLSDALARWRQILRDSPDRTEVVQAVADELAETLPAELPAVMSLFRDADCYDCGLTNELFPKIIEKVAPQRVMRELRRLVEDEPAVHKRLPPLIVTLLERASDAPGKIVPLLGFSEDPAHAVAQAVVSTVPNGLVPVLVSELLSCTARARLRARFTGLLSEAVRRKPDADTVSHLVEHGDVSHRNSPPIRVLEEVEETHPHVIELLESKYRPALAEMMVDVGAPEVLPILRSTVLNGSRREAVDAIRLTVRWGGKDGVEILSDVPRLDIRPAIARALGEIGLAEGAAMIHPFVGDSRPEVRLAAAEALGQIADQSSIETLHQLKQDPKPPVRAKADAALERICDAYAGGGIPQDAGAALPVMEILGRLRDGRGLLLLHPLLQHPTEVVRLAAANAVATIGHRDSLASLREALEEEPLPQNQDALRLAIRRCSGSQSFDLLVDLRKAADAPESAIPDDLDLEAMFPDRFEIIRFNVGQAVNDMNLNDLDGFVSYLDSACAAIVYDLFSSRPDLQVSSKTKGEAPKRPYEQIRDWGNLIGSDYVRQLVGRKAQASLIAIHETRTKSSLHHPEAPSGQPLAEISPEQAEQAKDAFRAFLADVLAQYGRKIQG
jgi:HEAT repeat protein